MDNQNCVILFVVITAVRLPAWHRPEPSAHCARGEEQRLDQFAANRCPLPHNIADQSAAVRVPTVPLDTGTDQHARRAPTGL